MNLSTIAKNLDRSDLRSIPARDITKWAEEAGGLLASAKVTRSYLLAIVERIGRVLGECQAQAVSLSQDQSLNYDDLIFLEPHIAYQAGRKSGGEKTALIGLKEMLATSLKVISKQEKREDCLKDLTRLNQLFQAMAAYYIAKGGGQQE